MIKADVCVIGSGFSGSIAASRLTEAGLSVTVLERGPWRQTLPVKSSGIRSGDPLPRAWKLLSQSLHTLHHPKIPRKSIRISKKGLFEYGAYKGVNTICSSGVGGGSHVYGALLERSPNADYWNGHSNLVSEEKMQAHLDRVKKELQAFSPESKHQIPNYTPDKWRNSDIFNVGKDIPQPDIGMLLSATDANSKIQRKASKFKGDSLFGSPGGAKGTVDFLYLVPAMQKGLRLLDMHEVKFISKLADNNYEITSIDLRSGKKITIQSRYVILAAGTMNTVPLLFASQEKGGIEPSPALGKGFGTNGDYSAIWELQDKTSDFTKGMPCHGRVQIKGISEKGPDYVVAGIDLPKLPAWIPPFIRRPVERHKHNVLLIGMGADAGDGHFTYLDGRLNVHYDQKNSPVFEQIRKGFKQVEHLSGKPVKYGYKAVTVHPFGGARLADSKEDGVINGHGEVYGNKGLFIVDAAALPKAVGGPPTLTIAAWSSFVSQQIAEEYALSPKKEDEMLKKSYTRDELITKSFSELDAVFKNLAITNDNDLSGDYWGKLISVKGTGYLPSFLRKPFIKLLEKLMFRSWKGKSFAPEKGKNLWGSYENPKRALSFNFGQALSRDGSGLVAQLNYDIPKNSKNIRKILGEARALNEHEWLARMYYGNPNCLYYVLHK